MVYRSGYVNNSYHLVHIIHAAMRDAGWNLVSGLSADGIDSVFYSSGSDGYQDIYVRVATEVYDTQTHGDVQFPQDDAYNGVVNFFAYQYFPDGGSVSDGCNEVGKYGPLLYFWDGRSNASAELEEYNMFTSTSSNGVGRVIRETGIQGAGTRNLIDRKTLYSKYSGSNKVYQFYLDQNPLRDYDDINSSTNFFNGTIAEASVYSRLSDTEPTLWALIGGSDAGFSTINLQDKTTTESADNSYAAPWGTATPGYGCSLLQGTRRTGKKKLYAVRGGGDSNMGIFDVDENSWSTFSAPSNVGGAGCAVLLSKEATGYDHDRWYLFCSWFPNYYFVSWELDDDGNRVGGYTAHASPGTGSETGAILFYAGGNKIFFINDDNDNLKYWTIPGSPTASGSWTTLVDWLNHDVDFSQPITMAVQDHLASKVKVDDFTGSKYWLFVDEDRVVVVTETEESALSNEYEFGYAGLFETYADNTTVLTTASVSSGESEIPVNNVSGFKIGSTYKLVGLDAGAIVIGFNGEERRFAAGENITVSGVSQSQSYITVSSPLLNDYNAGAKIGVDVQPVGVMLGKLDRMHTVNGPYKYSKYINRDPAYQFYFLQYPQQEITGQSERKGGYNVWPTMLVHSAIYDNDSTQYTNSDVRGQLKGVYFVSTDLPSETTVEYDGATYISFSLGNDLAEQVVIGPVE